MTDKRRLKAWMQLSQGEIDALDDSAWKHYQSGGCLCAARGSGECVCGAWAHGERSKTEDVLRCLDALGQAYRGGWNHFDGRELRNQLIEIGNVFAGKMTANEFLARNGITLDSAGYYRWTD